MSVHWLGDFVFVESGLGVRVKFDLSNTIYVTVTAEHLAATRGLCGIYNNNADGRLTCNNSVLAFVAILYWGFFGNHKKNQHIFLSLLKMILLQWVDISPSTQQVLETHGKSLTKRTR